MEDKTIFLLLSIFVLGSAKQDDKLPLCPTNIEYFPQSLPMHCRMPRNADYNTANPDSTMPPSPFYQSPPFNKQPLPMPIPPGGPMPFPFPGGPPPGAFPMPLPMPIPGPAHKLPVIVMPFYSPDPSYKKSRNGLSKTGVKGRGDERSPRRRRPWRRPRPHYTDSSTDTDTDTDTDCSDTDTSSDTSSSDSSSDYRRDNLAAIEERGWWKPKNKKVKQSGRRSNRRHSHKPKRRRGSNKKNRDLLTPVLQYVTKDGYVIFEKKISKGEAKDWLKMRSDDPDPNKAVPERVLTNENENEGIKENKNEDDDKSTERQKHTEVSTEKPRMLKKRNKPHKQTQ